MKFALALFALLFCLIVNAAPSAGGPWVENAWHFALEDTSLQAAKRLLSNEGFQQNGDSSVILVSGNWKDREFNGLYLVSAYFEKYENGRQPISKNLMALLQLYSDGINPIQKKSLQIVDADKITNLLLNFSAKQ